MMKRNNQSKYSVYVDEYRPSSYGSSDFYIGEADTITSAKAMIKRIFVPKI